MSILRETRAVDQAEATHAGQRRRSGVSQQERDIRVMLEQWARLRWPAARQVHELVVGRGAARADMVMVDTSHLVAIEIKSAYDSTDRLIHQAAQFRLASPELWIAVTARHVEDAHLVRYLLPSIGIALVKTHGDYGQPKALEVVAEPQPFTPMPQAMLSMLWVAELEAEAAHHRLLQRRAKPPPHSSLVRLLEKLTPAEQIAAVCRRLRARDALWRADPPIPIPEAPSPAAPTRQPTAGDKE